MIWNLYLVLHLYIYGTPHKSYDTYMTDYMYWRNTRWSFSVLFMRKKSYVYIVMTYVKQNMKKFAKKLDAGEEDDFPISILQILEIELQIRYHILSILKWHFLFEKMKKIRFFFCQLTYLGLHHLLLLLVHVYILLVYYYTLSILGHEKCYQETPCILLVVINHTKAFNWISWMRELICYL